MVELYSLRLYLRDDYQLYFIEEVTSRDKEELIAYAKERVKNNELYVPILLVFKSSDVIMV